MTDPDEVRLPDDKPLTEEEMRRSAEAAMEALRASAESARSGERRELPERFTEPIGLDARGNKQPPLSPEEEAYNEEVRRRAFVQPAPSASDEREADHERETGGDREASVTMAVTYAQRVRGCLIGGAIGDALGYPVEFSRLADVRRVFGPDGVVDLPPGGEITDDTQMTLFTAEALTRHAEQGLLDRDPTVEVYAAYLGWLRTQRDRTPPPEATGLAAQPWMYATRSPGNACLSGLGAPTMGTLLAPVNPNSKGCGAVMRAAPFGLIPAHGPDVAFRHAVHAGILTHGHPTGYLAAGAFAAIVRLLLDGNDLPAALRGALDLLGAYEQHREATDALRAALDLAEEGAPTAEKVERLGGGWVGEEALAIGVYAALCHQDPAECGDALLLAVNHSGDSDSTGSVCGNLLGVRHGEDALPAAWVRGVEGSAEIRAVADDLARACDR